MKPAADTQHSLDYKSIDSSRSEKTFSGFFVQWSACRVPSQSSHSNVRYREPSDLDSDSMAIIDFLRYKQT